MIGDLVTLPLRVTFRTASFFLRGSEEVLKRALALTGRSVEAEPRYGTSGEDKLSEPDATPAPAAPSPATPPPPTASPPPPPPAPIQTETPPATPLVDAPTHVSEEPTIVEELAEPGAEEGAGAEVRIAEPWDGYARMSANEVIARVGDSDAAELASVSLYESANQARQTVLSAVERQLALARRSGPSN
jgi:hypothetical protein